MQFYSAVECAKKHTLEYLPNKRTVSNKRTGWKICQKLINAQYLISAHSAEIFLEINKQTYATIR